MTEQKNFWQGEFGSSYTERNPLNAAQMDQMYIDCYSVTRTALNEDFFKGIDKKARILEVGCNVGTQLAVLKNMGFTNLYGVELQSYAVLRSRELNPTLNIIQGEGAELPFRDGFFDVVFTSGVLIHIHPNDLPFIMKEVVRCSSRYVMGFEYYAEEMRQVPYRNNANVLWKGDYAKMYREIHPTLKITKTRQVPYTQKGEEGNVDMMYTLEKPSI